MPMFRAQRRLHVSEAVRFSAVGFDFSHSGFGGDVFAGRAGIWPGERHPVDRRGRQSEGVWHLRQVHRTRWWSECQVRHRSDGRRKQEP